MINRVVVTGMGTLNPLGNDVETTCKNMLDGVSGVRPITLFDPLTGYNHLSFVKVNH